MKENNRLAEIISSAPIAVVGGIIFALIAVATIAREIATGGSNIRKMIRQASI